jgi:hypothetical protein
MCPYVFKNHHAHRIENSGKFENITIQQQKIRKENETAAGLAWYCIYRYLLKKC